MTFEELHELAALYALGTLDATEEAEFEAHLAACGRCQREVADLSVVVEELARAEAVTPPSQLRFQVLDQIARTPQDDSVDATISGSDVLPGSVVESSGSVIDLTQERVRRVERRSARLLLAAAAAFVFMIGGAAALLALADRDDAYDAVAALADAETLELESELGTVTVVYSPGDDRVGVLSANLSDPGEARTYELWLVDEDGVTPAGLFTPNNGEVREVFTVDDIETLGFGITIEPEGGSDQPTGDILFLDEFDA